MAAAINDRGQVVGTTEGLRAFVWHQGKKTVLGPELSDAVMVNEYNQIVGSAHDHAVLWTLRSG